MILLRPRPCSGPGMVTMHIRCFVATQAAVSPPSAPPVTPVPCLVQDLLPPPQSITPDCPIRLHPLGSHKY